ncbi:hypothetical protein F4804DRAFT_348896 [Jackrogersella minutella]|nr:hypothetical protein F4804DRAFT_348896 [Jackrogersella minutella]
MKTPDHCEPIAIIGTSCRLPGGSTSPSKLWALLNEPHDLSKEIPTSRFNPNGFYHPDGTHHGTTNVRNAYLLEEDYRHFDAQFFQTKPVEAESMDPQQRILLEIVYEAIEAAGLRLHDIRGTDTAVYVGVMGSDYADLILKDLNSLPTYLSTGTARSMLSNKISYFYDWHGPSMTIDTACSSSLVAMHQAVQVLQSGISRIAVAAGTNLILGPENFVAESKLNMLSPTGRSRMWDSSADGYARGDGFVCVILKRLKDAVNDGDDIESIIRGSGVNQDGRTKGITIPSTASQTALISQVYRAAGLNIRMKKDRCQYFEAHGTGTPAGDPIEAAAIAGAFFDHDEVSDKSPLFVGSCKTVLGHTEGAAGLAGLLKASLAVKHGFIPPNLHLHCLNPNVKPFYQHMKIPTTSMPWPTVPDGGPRRASINSFGFGGTNAHVVLESWPLKSIYGEAHLNKFSLLPFNFSALTQEALKQSVQAHLQNLKMNRDTIHLRDLAYTLAFRRSVFPLKASVGASSVDALISNLTKMLDKIGASDIQLATKPEPGGILGVFTGQGAQWAGMGRDLILSCRFVSDIVDRLEGYLREIPAPERPEWSLRDELLAGVDSSRLDEATVAQPLCTAVQIMLVDILKMSKVKLAAVVGHSSGEIAAAYAAGYLSDRDALYISYFRGLHANLSKGLNGERGAMMVVATTVEDAQDLCDFPELQGRISVAAINSPSSITLSGDGDGIALAKSAFEDEGKFTRMLRVDKAYHSNHMKPCSDKYITSLMASQVKIRTRSDKDIAWFSSVYGTLLPTDCECLEDVYWNTNMTQPVLFSQAINCAIKEKGPYSMAIEIGPHPALRAPVLESIGVARAKQIPYIGMLQRDKNSIESVSAAFGSIWSYIGDEAVDFRALTLLSEGKPRLLKDLPSYPWDHRRIHWFESQLSKKFRSVATPTHELLGSMLPIITDQERHWRNVLSLKEIPWLRDHKLQGDATFPAAGYVAMALEASRIISASMSVQTIELRDIEIKRPITFDDETTGVETLFSLSDITNMPHEDLISAYFKCFAVRSKSSATMTMVACGSLRLSLGESLLSSLPLLAPDPPNLVNIRAERIYSTLGDLGYEYTGSFRGLTAIRRKLDVARCLVANPSTSDPEGSLLVHPTLIDCAFQLALVAYSWPGDGKLFSLHVPTHIDCFTVNLGLALAAFRQYSELCLDCTLNPTSTAPIYGDISLYTTGTPLGSNYAIIQIEGLHATPVSTATPADDRVLFEDVVWGLAEPDAGSLVDDSQGTNLGSLAAQITFRHPHLHILEIRNAGEGFSQSILEKIEDSFLSFTVAFPSKAVLDMARKPITRHDRVEFKTFDIQSEVLSKKVHAPQYGMAVVSGLGHELESLEMSFRNIRKLLQPGGYVLISHPLDSGQSPSRDSESLITGTHFGSVLRKTGFSGIDSMISLNGTDILTSQAVDHRILALRSPLQTIPTILQDLYIIKHGSHYAELLIDDLHGLLQHHFKNIVVINGITDSAISEIPPQAAILSLSDLPEPIFKNMTANKLEGLTRLLDKSRTILWVTRGCLGDDPYANMIVGFGRTLLLERPDLQLQFLDFDPLLLIEAKRLAVECLRLLFSQEWLSIEKGKYVDLVWTIEPELALKKNGGLIIPRVIPNRERNDRCNSRRREVSKNVSLKDHIIEIQYEEASSSYARRDRKSPTSTRHIDDASNADIVVRYSSLLALRIDGAGYLFLVLGHIVNTEQRVLALSDIQASRVRVPREWCLPCHEGVTQEQETAFLSSVAWNMYAAAVLSCARPEGSILIHEPPPALQAALLRTTSERHIELNFLTTILESDTEQCQRRWPWIRIHPHLSLNSIKSCLPRNISVFVTNGPLSIHSSSDTHHTGSYMSSPAVLDIRERLGFMASCADFSPTDKTSVLHAGELTRTYLPTDMTIIDWAAPTMVTTTVQPVDAEVLFTRDKTYLLAGLAGELGQSLVKWMVDRGARYIVLTSRSPRISNEWLDSFKEAGAVIRVFSNDIMDKSSLQNLVQEIEETLPPIAGVANGAMVLEDTPIAEMTLDKMQKVMGPKVYGSITLHDIFSGTLDFFILFSSVAAVVGNRGQSNYSTANAFMCGLAAHRQARGLAASVIHIGAVVGTGYLTREVSQSVQNYLQKAGYMWMSESEFHQVFAEGVLASAPGSGQCYEIMSGLRVMTGGERNAVWYRNPKFQHCVLGQDDAITIGGGSKPTLSIKTRLASASNLAEIYEILADSFTKMLQTTLLLDAEVRMLGMTAGELGIDSLVAVTIRSWFSKELDVDISIMKVLGGATIESILNDAAERLLAELIPDRAECQVLHGSKPLGSEQHLTNLPVQAAASRSSRESTSKCALESPSEFDERITLAPTKLLPLSSSQSRFWFLQSLLEDPTTSNVTCLLSLKGPLRVDDLRHAVRTVGERHEGLRTSFVQKEGKPWQCVLKTSMLRLEMKAVNSDEEVAKEFKMMERHVFDLQSGETMKIILLVRSPKWHHLIVSYHHINMDGVSFMVLVTDLEKSYNGEKFSEPVLQYPDYSERQRKNLSHSDFTDQLGYWEHEYRQIPSTLPILPISRVTTRKPMARYGSYSARICMDAPLKARVQAVCRKQKTTLFHFFVAVFKVLLTRFSGVSDLSIGIAHAGRDDSNAFGSIGNFLNLLPLRLRSSPEKSFVECLQETKEKVYAALANASVPIDILFSKLGVERNTEHAPLFQAFVDYRNIRETQKFGNCVIEGHQYSIGRTGYDITLDVIDNTVGECTLTMMVQKDLYAKEDALLLLKSFLGLTSAFSEGLSLPMRSPSLYDGDMVNDALLLGRGAIFQTKWDTLLHAVDDISRKIPSYIALKDGLGNVLTYEEMSSKINAIASTLSQHESLGKGDARVAVFQLPGVYWICSMLAIMKLGAAYIPLDLSSSITRLSIILKESKASVILAHSQTMTSVSGLDIGSRVAILDIDSLTPCATIVDVPNGATATSTAIILYTSGSTGVPKGIALSHGALQSHMESCISQWDFGREVVLQQSAYSFDFSVYQIYLSILTGGTCYIVPREDRGDGISIAKIIAEEGITVTGGVPSECMSWLKYADSEALRKSNYKMMVSGGEPFSIALTEELRSLGKMDLRAINIYGPSEVTIASNAFEVRYYDDPEILKSPMPVGQTMPNYSVYILDNDLKPVPTGVSGQIAISGPISSGYVHNNQLNEERFIPDLFAPPGPNAGKWKKMHLSGDRGRLRPSDGAFIFEGRVTGDTQIKLRGIRIDVQDIESAIVKTAKGDIFRAVVSVRGSPDEFFVAHVLFSPRLSKNRVSSFEDHMGYLEELIYNLPLPQYMRPAIILPLDFMPFTVSGKIDRRAIEALPLPDVHRGKRTTRELSPTESSLREIWQSIVHNSRIPAFRPIVPESNFFNIGGNSLLLMRLQAKIREVLGIKIPLLKLFEATTLKGMAATIDNTLGGICYLQQSDIDWENETRVDTLRYNCPTPTLQAQLTKGEGTSRSSRFGRFIVLTGATGFLGRRILSSMIANPDVKRIYCVAVRKPDRLRPISDPRVSIHHGDLGATRLGLSLIEAENIFEEADTIIHNGADVSFLKTYASLHASNVNSTKELVRMVLTYSCSRLRSWHIPSFHYISTVGVAQLHPGISEFGPMPAPTTTPSLDGSSGYSVSKWVSERFLERFASHVHRRMEDGEGRMLRIVIHRPSSIIGPSVERSVDIVQNLIGYCRQLRAIPAGLEGWWKGWIDLVSVDTVAEGIMQHVFEPAPDEEIPIYVHHSGENQIPVEELKLYLEKESGVGFGLLPVQAWIGRAIQAGMHELVAAYMESLDKGNVLFTPKILR